jgi:hypothetical protein
MRRIALLLWCAFLLAGCSRGEPTLATVRGQVFYRGKPVPGGTIVFTPDPQRGGRGPQAWAEIDADGRYSLLTEGRKGAVPGWHVVTIAPPRDGSSGFSLPAEYRDPDQSGQRFEVKPERANQCDLHLE